MKTLSLIAFILLSTIALNSSAQTPQAIEVDLLKSFKKIDYYWNDKFDADTTSASTDSLEAANDRFGRKLQAVAVRFPFTITQKFESLRKKGLVISSSADNLFRIYSWFIFTGGHSRFYENVLQYKSGSKTYAILDSATAKDYIFPYNKLYMLTVNKRDYYLAVYGDVFNSYYAGEGIRIYSITNGRLADVKLIKTPSGLHNMLYYEYDWSSDSENGNHIITYDLLSKTITLPIVMESGKVTTKRIIYKFTGQYFERVKN